MPAWLAVTILGIIEGVTEFLPISSTGHLLLVENAGWVPRQSDLFNITIQSGAALAVLLAFGGRLRDLLGRLHEPAARAYLMKLALAFAITGAGGLVIKRLGFGAAEGDGADRVGHPDRRRGDPGGGVVAPLAAVGLAA